MIFYQMGQKELIGLGFLLLNKSNRIENPMYIICSGCKYFFHLKCIKPKITRKRLIKENFEFNCRSCEKALKGTKKRGRKSNKLAPKNNDEEMEVDRDENNNNSKMEEESDQEIVRIQVEKESQLIKPSKNITKTKKKYKIKLDPSILVDDNMHGGKELINSTILKSESEEEQLSNQEEYIEKEMSVDENKESNTKVIIKNTNNQPQIANVINKKPNTILETDCYLSERYIRILDKLIKTEVNILEKEALEFEQKYEEQIKIKGKSKVYKKNFNFLYLFQKRLKRKISSRKFKYMSLEKEDKGIFKFNIYMCRINQR